ncbi:MAG: hypothetical protein HQK63_16910 [Desulfamplus sp.]|nr:hypothetical protein [Desulfamplus sp.]
MIEHIDMITLIYLYEIIESNWKNRRGAGALRLERDALFVNQNCPLGAKFSSSANRIKKVG